MIARPEGPGAAAVIDIDPAELEKHLRKTAAPFLSVLLDCTLDDAWHCPVTFQTFTDPKPKPDPDPRAKVLPGSIEKLGADLARRNGADAGIFVSVNEMSGGGRTRALTKSIRGWWMDLDFKGLATIPSLENILAACPIEPTMIVKTPGGYHLYWLADAPMACDGEARWITHEQELKAIQRALASHGSDLQTCFVHQVLRVPGFDHRKGEPTQVETVTLAGPRYSRDQVRKAFGLGEVGQEVAAAGPAPKPASKEPAVGVDPDRADDRAQSYLLTAPIAVQDDGGDITTYKVACTLKDLGCTADNALALMIENWNDRCIPPWTLDELSTKVRNAYHYGREQPGSAAPEAVFQEVTPEADPMAGAESWTAEQIRQNAPYLATLRRANPSALTALIQHWDMFDVMLWPELSGLILDAEMSRLNLNTTALVADHAGLTHADVQLSLARLARENPEAYLLLVDRLVAAGMGKRPINNARTAGEVLLRKDDARRARTKDARTLVHFHPANLSHMVDDMEEAILRPGDQEQVFSFAGQFVTVRKAKPITVRDLDGRDCPPMPIIHTFTVHSMMERITRSVRLEALDGQGIPKGMPVSAEVVRMMLSRGGGSAPPLTGIIDSPTIRQDGTILDKEGYDPKTGLLAVFDGQTFPQIPMRPSREEVQEALQFIQCEVFAEFPFRDALDQGVAVAALLTGLVRSSIGIAPAFLVSAPVQSSGKTALCEVIAHGAYGRQPAASSWPADDVEMAKVILATLKEGHRTVLFDNIPDGRVVNSSQLATAISSEQFSARILGASDTATVPTSTLWLMTGNNIRLAGDLPTRVLRLYLDSKEERPDRRSFSRDLAPWVAEHRAHIVKAGLTIIRAYVAAGCPKVAETSTRFPHWDRMVRYPLIHAGGPDIGEKFTNSVMDDPTLAPWAEVLEAWHEVFGDEAQRTGEVLDRLEVASLITGRTAADTFNEAEQPDPVARLKDALKVAMNDPRFNKTNSGTLGTRLAQYENRPLGHLKLTSFTDGHLKVKKWKVEKIH